MMAQPLQSIEISGYKSIRSAQMELGDLNILIGANGSGKSNFVSVFKFLRQVVEQHLQVSVREAGGAEKFLYYGSKTTPEMVLQLHFPPNAYRLALGTSNDDNLFVKEETTFYHAWPHPVPFEKKVAGGALESKLRQYGNYHAVPKYVFETLSNWRVYHFHDTGPSAAVKKTGQLNDNLYLREDAANLAAFLYRMKAETPKHYERIVRTVQLVVPMFRDFLLRPDPFNPDNIRLEWLDKDTDFLFNASDLSDGSLRFICIATVLLQPNRPDLILFDEPELGLHPSAIQILAGLLKKTSTLSRLIISTQSVALVSAFLPEDIVVVEFKDRATTFQRLDADALDNWLMEYSLGELWEKNVLGGRP